MIDTVEEYFDEQDKQILKWTEMKKRAGIAFGKGERKIILSAPMCCNSISPAEIASALNKDSENNPYNNRKWDERMVSIFMDIGLIEVDDEKVYVMVPDFGMKR